MMQRVSLVTQWVAMPKGGKKEEVKSCITEEKNGRLESYER